MSSTEWVSDAAAASTLFLRHLLSAAEELQHGGLALYEHDYDYLTFRCWYLVAGSRYVHIKIIWDGKNSTLQVLRKELRMRKGSPSGTRPEWHDVETVSLPHDISQVFTAVRTILRQQLPT